MLADYAAMDSIDKGSGMLSWLRNRRERIKRRQQVQRLAQADAEALIRDHGGEAYSEARQRERDVILPDGTTHAGRTPAHWRRVALIVAKRNGHKVGLDTATRMLSNDFLRPLVRGRRTLGFRKQYVETGKPVRILGRTPAPRYFCSYGTGFMRCPTSSYEWE